jgi:ABC-type uncharacterized transport system substrate-binding protein
LPWALRTRIDETAIIDSTGVFWMEFLRRRREFITLLGGAAAALPLAARAQQPDRMRRIGIFMSRGEDLRNQLRIEAFAQRLLQLGWIERQNVQFDYRWGVAELDRTRRSAEELVALAPDVILTSGSPTLGALLQATRTVPIVFANVPDPVGAGFVDSLARPGGNATGFTLFEYSIIGKSLQLLTEIAPHVSRERARCRRAGACYRLLRASSERWAGRIGKPERG